MGTRLSVVLPAYNEASNLEPVIGELLEVLDAAAPRSEVLVVDDGSEDDTNEVLARLERADPRVRGVRLRRNCGKSTALAVGLASAEGDIIITMDADGQFDPRSIPDLIGAIGSGADLVTGRRTRRLEPRVKTVTSALYNRATSSLTGVRASDFNSGFKAMRREVAESIRLYGELHRYIPVLAHWAGFRVAEVPIVDRARLSGRTKFGRSRFWRGALDLITVKFLTTFTTRPLHLFGGVGLVLGILGSGLLGWMAYEKLIGNPVGQRPALIAGVLLTIVAVQFLCVGLLAELVVASGRPRDVRLLVRDRR